MRLFFTLLAFVILTVQTYSQVITLGTVRNETAPQITESHVQVYVSDGTVGYGYYCRIIPGSTSEYSIETRGSYDTMGSLYDSGGNLLVDSDAGGDGGDGESGDFLILQTLTAGQTYYLAMWNFEATVNLVVDLYISGGTLPVELSAFTASVSNSKVELNWQTATEVNNYGFEVERSTVKGEWLKVGFIEGAGNSNSPKEYSFTDNLTHTLTAPGGRQASYSYRLKQIDLDGSFTYSKEITVDAATSLPTDFSLSQNYPNPFNPITTIKYAIPTPPASSPLVKGRTEVGFVTLKVYNLLGQEVATLVNQQQSAGNYEVKFDASNLASGIYLYKLQAGEFSSVKKLILMK